jgi:hypothetical protein
MITNPSQWTLTSPVGGDKFGNGCLERYVRKWFAGLLLRHEAVRPRHKEKSQLGLT